MTSNNLIFFVLLVIFVVECSPQQSPSIPIKETPISRPRNGRVLTPLNGNNVMSLTVNGSLCSQHSYLNKPCVQVTLCSPNDSTQCQTINDILLDTGSYGLRVFKSVLNYDVASSLEPVTQDSQTVAECTHYADGTADWGPIATAGVILGNEPMTRIPIQIIDAEFSGTPDVCKGAEASPVAAGFNGILGVGIFKQDCGVLCATHANNHTYFGCDDSTCTGLAAELKNQVQNPVAALPVDNNGVIVELPYVELGGQDSAEGYLVLGIGTQKNNIPEEVSLFNVHPGTGDFKTEFNGQSFNAFLDTGSNGIFLPGAAQNALPDCSSLATALKGWFCPASILDFSGINSASAGSTKTIIPFQIGHLGNLITTAHSVFQEVGASNGGTTFVWGLPFHLGRNVYIGFQDAPSSIGAGPYWAY